MREIQIDGRGDISARKALTCTLVKGDALKPSSHFRITRPSEYLSTAHEPVKRVRQSLTIYAGCQRQTHD